MRSKKPLYIPLETEPYALPSKITIIGNKGRMGQMLYKNAEDLHIPVAGVDIPYEEDETAKAFKDTALALLCVPARNLEETLVKLIKYIPETAILADITSVKEKPMSIMEKLWPGKVIGTHPLFGPKPDISENLPVAIIAGKNADSEDLGKVGKFFSSWGCAPFICSAAQHDQAVARIQNMNFITNLAYFAVLAEHEELLPFLTPSFERRKKAAAKMLTEDSDMFSGLFEANNYSHEAVRQYRKMLNVAASGDINLLCNKAKWWWEEDLGNSGKQG